MQNPGGRPLHWDYSILSLAEQFDLEDFEGDWNSVQDAVEQGDEPVIVTIANPSLSVSSVGDHAIVLWKIERTDDGVEHVIYMNPLTADHERMQMTEFVQWWLNPGARAIVIRP